MTVSASEFLLDARFEEIAHTALQKAITALRDKQRRDGHWCAELEGDSTLQSEYLLMKWILGQEKAPLVDGRGPDVLDRITDRLRSQQREDGGWGRFPGSDVDPSATVKGYFALKLHGDSPEAPHMVAARNRIHELDGVERVNTRTNVLLACLGQVSWNAVPSIPPELVLLPRWFHLHLDRLSASARMMILPLSLVATLRPTRRLDASQSIDELHLDRGPLHRPAMRKAVPRGWRRFFVVLDRVLKVAHDLGGSPWRRRAIDASFAWIENRAGQDGEASTDGVGAIFPPMVFWQIVLMATGHDRTHPLVRRAEIEIDELMIEDPPYADGTPGMVRLQPCFSPVRDTGIALQALNDCGLDVEDASCAAAAGWLRSKECRFRGDRVRGLAPERGDAVDFSGWHLQYHNAWYPDLIDTAVVVTALHRTGGRDNRAAAQRGLNWIRAMQNADGGWATFDRTVELPILEQVPFADHDAMQDPSRPDITGTILECLSWTGVDDRDPMVREAIEYVKGRQEPEGCWSGRGGVSCIHGTWQSVTGPIRCGEDPRQLWIQKAAEWLESVQQPDGGFGEIASGCEDRSLMDAGPSTASQTAWAAMTLQEIRGADHPSVMKAIRWLCDTQLDEEAASDLAQNPDGEPAGCWSETEFTGTGFPPLLHLRHHLYRHSYPLMAIGRWLEARHPRG
ncbi:MAG: squalene--hopene cyclase [Phycisphaerae bacterium]|nr:squalene--hopene cyclase [Phycisphaerae bacterium]